MQAQLKAAAEARKKAEEALRKSADELSALLKTREEEGTRSRSMEVSVQAQLQAAQASGPAERHSGNVEFAP